MSGLDPEHPLSESQRAAKPGVMLLDSEMPPAPEPLPVLDFDAFFAASLEATSRYFEDVMKYASIASSPLDLRKVMSSRMEDFLKQQWAAAEKYLGVGPKP